jgi:hypothetical protein
MNTNKKLLIGLLVLIFIVSATLVTIEFYITNNVKSKITKHIENLSKFTTVSYDALSVNWTSFSVSMNNVKIDLPLLAVQVTVGQYMMREAKLLGVDWLPPLIRLKDVKISTSHTASPVTIESITISDISTRSEILTQAQTSLQGITFPLDENLGKFAKDLKKLGYDTIRAQLDIGYNHNIPSEETKHDIKLIFHNMGQINVAAHLGNVKPKIFDSVSEISVKNLNISYKDNSFLQKSIAEAAKTNNLSVKDFIDKTISDLDQLLTLFSLPANLKEQVEPLKKFILNPERLEINFSFKKLFQPAKTKFNSLEDLLNWLKNVDVKISSEGAKVSQSRFYPGTSQPFPRLLEPTMGIS